MTFLTNKLLGTILKFVVSILFMLILIPIAFNFYKQGLEAFLIGILVIGGCFWGWVIKWLLDSGRLTFSHILTIWLVFTGTALGGYSYYLARIGCEANLSDLSRYIFIEVVATPAGYFIKSGIENVRRMKCSSDLPINDPEVVEESFEEAPPL